VSPPLCVARDLGRWYGPVVGLNDLSVTIPGGVIGLLGPNGAGKSTLLKLVAGEIRPSRGTLEVLGLEPFANREYFRRLGFCPQQDAMYGDMNALEFVSFLMRLSGFSPREARDRAARALERVALGDAMLRRTREYSKGMRQRVKVAQAIAHDPEFLILDEPLTGLDPIARRDMVALFAELGRAGKHILVSSHVLHEVESLTEDILLLHRGRLLAQGTVHEVRALLSRHPRKVELRARESRRLARALLSLGEVSSVRVAADGRGLSVETTDVEAFFARLPEVVLAERAGIESLESPDASLEAVFDYLIA
jgi:ABC-2 type transport system ATP-binding protein